MTDRTGLGPLELAILRSVSATAGSSGRHCRTTKTLEYLESVESIGPAYGLPVLQDLGSTQVLLTAGGVSMGERDFLPQVLEQLGAHILFHRIRLKPGKPMLAALLDGRVILCLPGNPVSAYLNTLLFLPVVLARLEGHALPIPWRTGRLAAQVPNPGDRPLLHPCKRRGNELEPLSSRGSADLVRLAQADVCAWIPEGGMEAGETRYLELL